jgi:hypothetical protein
MDVDEKISQSTHNSWTLMELTPIASNQTLVTFPNYSEVFFSYKTPVAGYHPDLGYVKTKTWYSQTTTRHINKYLESCTAKEVDQDVINKLVIN